MSLLRPYRRQGLWHLPRVHQPNRMGLPPAFPLRPQTIPRRGHAHVVAHHPSLYYQHVSRVPAVALRSCATSCHERHLVRYIAIGQAYCDCAAASHAACAPPSLQRLAPSVHAAPASTAWANPSQSVPLVPVARLCCVPISPCSRSSPCGAPVHGMAIGSHGRHTRFRRAVGGSDDAAAIDRSSNAAFLGTLGVCAAAAAAPLPLPEASVDWPFAAFSSTLSRAAVESTSAGTVAALRRRSAYRPRRRSCRECHSAARHAPGGISFEMRLVGLRSCVALDELDAEVDRDGKMTHATYASIP